jgi:S1-C subfamily serine protease
VQAKQQDSKVVTQLLDSKKLEELKAGKIVEFRQNEHAFKLFSHKGKIFDWTSSASAYLVSKEGHLVTHAHAVTPTSQKTIDSFFILTQIEPLQLHEAAVIWNSWEGDSKSMKKNVSGQLGSDKPDLAILRAEYLPSIAPLDFHLDKSYEIKSNINDAVRTIGFPVSYDELYGFYGSRNAKKDFLSPKISGAQLSGRTLYDAGMFQGTVGPGNSGGPLINVCGEVIGTIDGGTTGSPVERFLGSSTGTYVFLDKILPKLDQLSVRYSIAKQACSKGLYIE